MATYKSKKDILSATLGEYAELGFTLHEPDDHMLVLQYKGETIMVYDQLTTTIAAIRVYCYYYLHEVLDMEDKDILRMRGVIK